MNETNKSLFLWGGVILGIIVFVGALALFGSGNAGSGSNTSLSTAISSDEHTKGATDASVAIVEYSDFQCPGCASSYPMLKQLVDTFPNDVSLTYRHYPLRQIHSNAQLAGQAAEAAGMQGKFWEMHDVLFNTQAQWSTEQDPTAFFTRLAESVGLDLEQFGTDLTSKEAVDRVHADASEANKLRLPGTPSFFINGTLIDHPGSYAAFKALVEAELAQ